MSKLLLIVLIFLALGLIGGGIFVLVNRDSDTGNPLSPLTGGGDSDAIKAGKELSNNNCSGEGPGVLTHSPMDPEDFSIIIPYGAVIGGHVTPIDHQYFAPKDYQSARDSYEVYAMADSRLVDIGPRTNERGTEYRLVFSMTCTFLYYYDLVTSLAPDIKAEYDKKKNASGYASLDMPVTAGQLIGRIGGQTLDFAVWDTTKPLKGFVNPESYLGEKWKRYTADPLDYYSPELKELALSRYVRTAEPVSGKIDYDIDGRLIGNWFAEGSGGYAGPGEGREGYWKGHLSLSPDNFDPSAFIVSIGDFNGEAQQFAVKGNAPKPEEVSVATGLVEYELVKWSYQKADGSDWDRMSLTKGVKFVVNTTPAQGCVLVQLIEDRKLRMESFPGKNCASLSSFTSAATLYTR